MLGHAVIATLVRATSDFPATGDLLDLWVTRFGVAGAAQLVASMTQLGVARSTPSDGRPAYEGPPAIGAVAPDLIQGPIVTTRCRGGQVEGFRPWDPHIRLRRLVDAMIVYLLPSQQEWVDAAPYLLREVRSTPLVRRRPHAPGPVPSTLRPIRKDASCVQHISCDTRSFVDSPGSSCMVVVLTSA